MKRALLAIVAAALLAAVPATVSADRATKYTDHRVSVFCESEIDGGYVSAFIESGETFGDTASAEIWLGDALPFEDPSTLFGFSDVVNADEGEPVTLSADLAYFDSDGGDAGTGALEVSLARVGDPEEQSEEGFGNSVNHTTRTIQFLEGEGALALPDGTDAVLPCFGEIVDERVFFTNPHTFVFDNEGIVISCGWSIGEDGFAFFFASEDNFGSFADAGLITTDLALFGSAEGPDISASGVSASFSFVDDISGDPYTAEASAAFDPLGDPVTSFLVVEQGKFKLVEQRLAVDGSLEFSTGDAFTMDTASCFANTFSEHRVFHANNGPKPAAAPSNDAPEGAIALSPGDRIRVNTSGTALDAELPITTCPEGPFDNMGHTVWYTVEGTGGELTVDTAKSNFDTVIAVYVMEGDELVEIACNDDVFYEPIGSSLQAAITGPTEAGVTYWIQVGGYQEWFDPSLVDSGRLKLSIR